jgi:redox-sensitive bicupin YhaK (pirin superfamily)
MIRIRPAEARGTSRLDWLDSKHTFSFADYVDPKQMGFRTLRVINEDRVAPAKGFGTHPHRDMEIVSYVLEGAIEHKDSMGNGSVIQPGDVQRMTAGTGVMHSEFNPSPTEPVHFLQIWIQPERRNLEPGYEQKRFPESERQGRLRLVASPDGAGGSLTIHQDAKIFSALLKPGERVAYALPAGRHAWVQLARGSLAVNGEALEAGDGAAIDDESEIALTAKNASELLLFDLA